MKLCVRCDQLYMTSDCPHCVQHSPRSSSAIALHMLLGFGVVATGCGDKEDTATEDTSVVVEPAMEMDYGVPDTGMMDADGDGYTEADGDCNDSDPEIHPNATETPNDSVDSNCDGEDNT